MNPELSYFSYSKAVQLMLSSVSEPWTLEPLAPIPLKFCLGAHEPSTQDPNPNLALPGASRPLKAENLH